jgi:antirestriction protein ArdC
MKATAKKSSKGAPSTGLKGGRKNSFVAKTSPIDVYERFTNLIIEKLEQGIIPWHQPWSTKGMPSNYLSKRPYHGINLWILLSLGHELPFYLTFKQADSLGGRVKKGAKAIPVCYWNFVYKHKETGRTIPTELVKDYPMNQLTKMCFLKEYKIFPIELIEGIEWVLPEVMEDSRIPEIERCEAVYAEMLNPPKVVHEKEEAFYHPKLDLINMPPKQRFKSPEGYYAVLFHELTHSTGSQNRLNRPGVAEMDYFGSSKYCIEELIAEMGAGYLCGYTGIENDLLIENQAAYLQNWITQLKNDKQLIIEAASKAQKAVDYILMTCPF